jgi:hypothetical protein
MLLLCRARLLGDSPWYSVITNQTPHAMQYVKSPNPIVVVNKIQVYTEDASKLEPASQSVCLSLRPRFFSSCVSRASVAPMAFRRRSEQFLLVIGNLGRTCGFAYLAFAVAPEVDAHSDQVIEPSVGALIHEYTRQGNQW